MRASASAKIILMGEHAVVYGTPAIAMPIPDLRAWAEARPAAAFCLNLQDIGQQLSINADHPLTELARLILQALDTPAPPVEILIHSDIPIASGLGSGAALSAATARALLHALGQSLSPEQLNEAVYQIERLYHGTPSGVDNTVIVYEKPIWFIRNQEMRPIRVGQPLIFVVADTGIAAPTYQSVGDVRRLMEAEPERIRPIVQRVAQAVTAARDALAQGDSAALGALMDENQALLQQLTVSSDELEHLISAARHAGALGAKLSGGGRGGNMIALARDEAQAQAILTQLQQAGAKRAFLARLPATEEAE